MRYYHPKLKPPARTLRTNLTESEQRLWSRLRRKQVWGVQFYRQKPLGFYIVDFYAPSVRLVVEVDGAQHQVVEQAQYDRQRTAYLECQGLRVLRFTNVEVFQELEAVVEEIGRAVQEGVNPPRSAEKKIRGCALTRICLCCPLQIPLRSALSPFVKGGFRGI